MEILLFIMNNFFNDFLQIYKYFFIKFFGKAGASKSINTLLVSTHMVLDHADSY